MIRSIGSVGWFLLIVGASLRASPAYAHFTLLKPASWIKEDSQGGPQKGGPCGPGGYDESTPATPSGAVTTFHAGEEISVEWKVTVGHTGFYRIALAKDRGELKDPGLNPDGLCNFSTPIKNPPDYPVLIDNIDSAATSQKVKIPADLTCDKCTLQVIMWMTNHPPGCIYYHCADLKILPAAGAGGAGGAAGAGSGGSGSAGAGSAGAGSAGRGSTGTGTAGQTSTGRAGAGSGGSASTTPAGGGTAGNTAGGTTATAGTGVGTGPTQGVAGTGATGSSSKSGCSVASDASPSSGLGFLLLIVPALARRRRAA